MARSRNIKPGFFTNDLLCELPPLTRLLFAGLWTVCDREGRVEDRPKKIKAEVLPYDDCDAESMLQALHVSGFIRRYAVNGRPLIQVLTWAKHQNPHLKEAKSLIPPPCDLIPTNSGEQHSSSTVLVPYKNEESTVQAPDENSSSTVQASDEAQPLPERAGLIPDSLNLIPDSLIPPVAVAPSPPKGDDPPPAAPAPEPPPPAPAPQPRKTRAAAAAKAASDFERPDDIPLGVWSEFLAYRLEMAKGNREAPFTAAAMKGVIRDIRKCGMKGESPEDALYRCMARGWRTPYPEKDMPVRVGSDAPRRMTQHEINSQRGAAFREPLAPKLFGEKHERNQPDIEDVQFRDAVDPESDPYKGF